MTSPAFSQTEDEAPTPEWEGAHWTIAPAIKWDGVGWHSVRNAAVEGNLMVGVEAMQRMTRYFGVGGSLYFLSVRDTALEMALNMRYYYPLLKDRVHPYLGLQLGYLTQDNGGFSLALRPGLELKFLSMFQLGSFVLIRYDLMDALNVGAFRSEQLLFGGGMEAQYAF